MRDMFRLFDSSKCSLINLSATPSGNSNNSSGLKRILTQKMPSESARRNGRVGRIGTFCSLVDRYFRYRREIDSGIPRVRQFLKEEKPDQIWAILNSTAVIDICFKLRDELDATLLLQVWDDPVHILRERHLDRLTIRNTMTRFNELLSKATRVGVISEEMAESYKLRTRGEIFIIRHGLDRVVKPRFDKPSEIEFRIGFCGAMYAGSAWKAFQQALDALKWELDGRKIVLIALGSQIQFKAGRPCDARYFGWRSVSEVVDKLADCDLLYLPQSFESMHEPLTRLSFPTKLSTYVATGRPVFLHTPVYGSLSRFSSQHCFGLLCNSLGVTDIAESLKLLENDEAEAELAHSSARIAREVLSSKIFSRQVNAFLG